MIVLLLLAAAGAIYFILFLASMGLFSKPSNLDRVTYESKYDNGDPWDTNFSDISDKL